MSAWIVSKNHIDCLVQWSIRTGLINATEADATGRRLWAENLLSVAYRYPNDENGERPGPVDFRDEHVLGYTYSPAKAAAVQEWTLGSFDPDDPRDALKQAECYDYQTCEHPGWVDSDAKTLVHDLIGTLDPLVTSAAHSARRAKAPTREIAWGV